MSGGVIAAADESAVKSRLLYDGDGSGEERRLNILLKSVLKWCGETGPVDEADDIRTHAKLMSQLMQIEWSDAKSKLVQEMNIKEASNYEGILEKIKTQIESAEADIVEAKKELQEARHIRKNRMEYDAMAKQINQYPSREVTGKNIEDIQTELARLTEEEERLDSKLQMRKNQFHVLVHSIHQLQALLDKEEEMSSASDALINGHSTTEEELNTSNVSSSPEETHMEIN